MKAWVEYERRRANRVPWYTRLRPGLWFNRARRERQQYIWDTGYHWGEWLEPGSTIGPKLGLGIVKRMLFGEPTVATAYLAYSSGLLAEAARVLGNDSDAREYAQLAREASQAYADEFIRADGRIKPDTQASYTRALAFHLAPPERRPALLGHLVRKIREAGTHIGTGFLSTPFLLRVLSENGQLGVAYELLNQTTIPSWLYAVTRGATTIWETWDGIDEAGNPHGSLNHYSYGAVSGWLAQTVAGIEIGGPGYQQVRIQPQPGGGLTWARASYQSVYGEIASAWEISGGAFTLRVTIPPNTRGTVRLPGACRLEDVRESGIALEGAFGVTGAREAEGAVLLEIGSGSYTFQYPYSG